MIFPSCFPSLIFFPKFSPFFSSEFCQWFFCSISGPWGAAPRAQWDAVGQPRGADGATEPTGALDDRAVGWLKTNMGHFQFVGLKNANWHYISDPTWSCCLRALNRKRHHDSRLIQDCVTWNAQGAQSYNYIWPFAENLSCQEWGWTRPICLRRGAEKNGRWTVLCHVPLTCDMCRSGRTWNDLKVTAFCLANPKHHRS